MKKSLSILLSFFLYLPAFSQSTDDVVRIMNEDVAGTARTMGLGGAQSVLGADIGSFQYNPAAIGLFRSSQIAISGASIFNDIETNFFNQEFSNSQQYATVNNFGIAFATTDDENEKLKSYTIGFSYHRKNTFENDFTYSGLNGRNSFTSYLGEQSTLQREANPDVLNVRKIIDPIENLPQMAWKSELIKDPINDSLFDGAAENGGVLQEHIFDETGFYNNWDITMGANYNDLLYFGGSVGIHYYEYGYESQFIEQDAEDTIPNFVGFTFQDEYQVQGMGSNFKLGAIVRPIDWFRIGLSVETPTIFALESSQTISLLGVITDDDSLLVAVEKDFEIETEIEKFTFTTPMKYTFGMVFLAGKYGLITTDIERVNYANSSFSNQDDIQDELKNATNVRLGLEGRHKEFRARVGAAFNGSPYLDEKLKGKRYFTFGGGYKTDTYFVDFAYVTTKSIRLIKPYELVFGLEPTTELKQSTNTFTITLGSKF